MQSVEEFLAYAINVETGGGEPLWATGRRYGGLRQS